MILCHLSACTAAANWANALVSTAAQPQVRLHVTRGESWSDASKRLEATGYEVGASIRCAGKGCICKGAKPGRDEAGGLLQN